jgi:hypothetical protein
MGSSALLAPKANFTGRFANPWVLGYVTILPATTFFACVWVAVLLQTRIIYSFEDGTYTKPFLDISKDFYNKVKIWHGLQPSGSARALPDLEAQAPELSDKMLRLRTTLPRQSQRDKLLHQSRRVRVSRIAKDR